MFLLNIQLKTREVWRDVWCPLLSLLFGQTHPAQMSHTLTADTEMNKLALLNLYSLCVWCTDL